MYPKWNHIDIFNNSEIVYMRKPNNLIISWISILIIGSILFGIIIFFYKFETSVIYYGKVINVEEDNYISMAVDEEFINLKNRNYLTINNKECKCHLRSMSDNYYILNGLKYWEAIFDCEIADEININDNIIEVKIEKEKQTLFDKIVFKIRKGLKNGRIRN